MQWLNMAYLRWYTTQIMKKIGVLGIVALAIALGCCLFYTFNILPLQQKIADDANKLPPTNPAQILSGKTEKSQLTIALKQITPEQTTPEQTTPEQIKRFYTQFPASDTLPNCLRLIDNIALKQRLTLNRGDYKLTQIKSLQSNQATLSRYEIVLPVTGQYVQIRKFIAQVLHELPALALSDLQLKRESAQSPSVEARLMFVILLKNNSANQLGADSWQ